MIAAGEIGAVHFVHGSYLQDWLLEQTDFSWRLEPDKGGVSSAVGDIGSHWCDLVQHVVGAAHRVGAGGPHDRHPDPVQAEPSPGGLRHRDGQRPARAVRRSRARISRPCCCASTSGAKGCVNDRAGVRRAQERPLVRSQRRARARCAGCRNSRTSCGSATAIRRTSCCRKIRRCCGPARARYAHLPGGHQEAWADAFRNVMRDIYGTIAGEQRPAAPPRCHVRGRLSCRVPRGRHS